LKSCDFTAAVQYLLSTVDNFESLQPNFHACKNLQHSLNDKMLVS
jgi:hypothetical protein